jgi:hypothetical protein
MASSTDAEWDVVLKRVGNVPDKALQHKNDSCWSSMAQSTPENWVRVLQRLNDLPEKIDAIRYDSLWSSLTNLSEESWELIKQRLPLCRISWFSQRSFWPYFANTTRLGNTFWNTDGKEDMSRDKKVEQYKAYMANNKE